ncbi:lytic transglycosylase domain-containing protein [Paenibacillus guangzhouensis]|uniref:lytic transglycosylase domain-containing protein n=1 Tax=Paenibacillus guangzhouensis TaxID=1473112 RepID=UPI0012674B23|nr:lytic transglycosylase domain-containing protein [Paenibacillus guangzhouensis]
MQIDPRLMKQMIQMQVVNNIDLTGTALESTTVPQGSSNDFGAMLEQLLMGAEGLTDDSSTTSNLNLSALASLYPAMGQASSTATDGMSDWSTQQPTITTEYDDLIRKASQKYGISEALIKAVIKVESSFNPDTVSSAGAKGLMQLMDATARGLGVSNSFDPAQSIDGGTRYLSYQLRRFDGQEKLALAAYNGGPNRLARLGIKTEEDLMAKLHLLPQETQNYLRKIDNALQAVTV